MLRVQVSYIFFFFIKEEIGKKEKNREKRREEKRICPDLINKLIPLHLWFDRVEIWRRDLKLE